MRKALPPLLFFTDPARIADPLAIARRLPRGSAIVLRTFGAQGSAPLARALRRAARERGLTLLIGQDARLAQAVGADGVHLPERLAHRALPIRRARPDWVVTVAAHSLRASRARGADAVVVSSVFPSRSPSAGRPLGPIRLAALARGTSQPVYALGGVNDASARRLLGAGVIGMAAVDAFRT